MFDSIVQALIGDNRLLSISLFRVNLTKDGFTINASGGASVVIVRLCSTHQPNGNILVSSSGMTSVGIAAEDFQYTGGLWVFDIPIACTQNDILISSESNNPITIFYNSISYA